MLAGDLLERGRAAAEALMLDECTITAPGVAAPVWDEETGEFTYPPAGIVYQGKCKVQTADSLKVASPEAGELVRSVNSVRLDLPVVGSEAVAARATVTFTGSAHDAALVGRVFTVAGPHVGSLKTARRLPCEGVT